MSLKRFNFNKKKGWPSFYQWMKLPQVLSKTEKKVLFLLIILTITSSAFLFFSFYSENTLVEPSKGGHYTEGLVGQPRFINPVYADLSDVDKDLTEIMFSGLMKYNEKGELVNDLAKSFEIKEDGKVYEFEIKENALWSDGEKLTVDDIVFTIETIQNPNYKSPLRAEWLGVNTEIISDFKVRFNLQKPSFVFLESTTLKIMPRHIWQEVSPDNFSLASIFYNQEPIGSGPYKLKSYKKNDGFIESLTVEINEKYHSRGPFISEIEFIFFANEEDLIKTARRGELEGFYLNNAEHLGEFNKGLLSTYELNLPRYFAVFLNPEESEILEDKEVRKALSLATDRKELVEKVLYSKGKVVNSPMLPEIYGYSPPSTTQEFNLQEAKKILDEAGYIDNNGDGFREKSVQKDPAFQFTMSLNVGSENQEVTELQRCLAKDPEIYPEAQVTGYFGSKTKTAAILFQEKYANEILTPLGLTQGTGKVGNSTIKKLNELCFPASKEILPLQLSLVTVDQHQLVKVADILKSQWGEAGIKTEINALDIVTLEKDFIKTRGYESLLFGEVLNSIPDPFPFWHSSQVKDPGLNLSLYKNEEADKFLEQGREASDPEIRRESYENFQEEILKDYPAIFLYSPSYTYLVKKEIKGINEEVIINPSKRFSNIENWYIKTKRVWQ